VYVACGAAANTSNFLTPGPVAIAIALAFGLTLFTLCFMIGHISGGHLNPVISIVFVFLRKIKPIRGIMYVLAQFVGTLVGAALLRASTPPYWTVGGKPVPNCLASNQVSADVTPGVAFLVEIVLTFFLLMVVCAATDANKSNQTLIPLAIGVCVTCCHLMALPVDGCSLNPTRSFASAAIANYTPGCDGVWSAHWVFWFGPFFGGALGAIVYDFVFHDGGTRGENLLKQYLKPRRA
jgi:MIP family channel proteins